MTWAIETTWRFEAVEVTRETEKCVFYKATWRGGRETRGDKGKFLDWRGDEDTARSLVAKLTSAKAEYDRRVTSASEWFKVRKADILFASGMETRQGGNEVPSRSDDSPTLEEGDALHG